MRRAVISSRDGNRDDFVKRERELMNALWHYLEDQDDENSRVGISHVVLSLASHYQTKISRLEMALNHLSCSACENCPHHEIMPSENGL